MQAHVDCTPLAAPTLVPSSDVSGAVLPPSEEGSDPESGQDSSALDDDQDSEPDCMAAFVQSYTKAGLSAEAAALAGEARRPATRKTYNVRIRKYRGWCRDNQVSPYTAPLGAVADFLTWVFKQGASCRSVRACRTAVAAIHHGFAGGMSVSRFPVLNDLVKAIFNKRPPSSSLVPSWDLPRALRILAEPPFEPMDQCSMMDLSRKTAFLVAAASGRRVSDIGALSVAENHLTVRSDGVHLLPRAGYLAKNQTQSFTPKHIVLPDHRKAAGSPDDGPWCPVRALKFYLRRTASYRGKVDHLFITAQKPFKPASRQTISRWIVSIIKDSLDSELGQLEGSHVRAHDLRSQTASGALYKGASLKEIMEAQGWSTSTTFQTVYLRDALVPRATTAAKVLSSASSSAPSIKTRHSEGRQ